MRLRFHEESVHSPNLLAVSLVLILLMRTHDASPAARNL